MSDTKVLPADVDAIAPDGSDVRLLLGLDGGGLAHFQLAAGATSVAVHHRTVEEIWYVVGGAGEMWRGDADGSTIVPLRPAVCLTIRRGTHFQFRAFGAEPLAVIAVTMPPWPGDGEAIRSADGPWQATVAPGPGLAER